MKGKALLSFIFIFFWCSLAANDSIKVHHSPFISFQTSGGILIPSGRIHSEGKKHSGYSAYTFKYGSDVRKDKWKSFLSNTPYKGIAFYLPRFTEKCVGNPFAIFLFQGGLLHRFSPDLSLNYELNLGASFNWGHYREYEKTDFTALGSSTNVHVSGSGYFKWKLSQAFDLHTGISFTHFSNGSTRTPNYGMNTPSAFVELVYYFDRKEEKNINRTTFLPPPFEKQIVHDLSFMFTTRTLKVKTANTGLISKFPKHRFKVAGINYSYMFHHNRRLLFGPSLETVYDESVNVIATGEIDPDTGFYTEQIKLSKTSDRFSAGLSLKGEIKMPGYSIFGNLGYNILHKDHRDKRLYYIYGIKLYMKDTLYGTFGVRSNNVTRSQYLYLNVGYTFRQSRKAKKN